MFRIKLTTTKVFRNRPNYDKWVLQGITGRFLPENAAEVFANGKSVTLKTEGFSNETSAPTITPEGYTIVKLVSDGGFLSAEQLAANFCSEDARRSGFPQDFARELLSKNRYEFSGEDKLSMNHTTALLFNLAMAHG